MLQHVSHNVPLGWFMCVHTFSFPVTRHVFLRDLLMCLPMCLAHMMACFSFPSQNMDLAPGIFDFGPRTSDHSAVCEGRPDPGSDTDLQIQIQIQIQKQIQTCIHNMLFQIFQFFIQIQMHIQIQIQI